MKKHEYQRPFSFWAKLFMGVAISAAKYHDFVQGYLSFVAV